LDEPTAGVDVELRQTLWQFIAKFNAQGQHGLADHALLGRSRGVVQLALAMFKQGRRWWRWPTRPASCSSRLQAAMCFALNWMRRVATESWKPLAQDHGAHCSTARATTLWKLRRYLAAVRQAGAVRPEDIEIRESRFRRCIFGCDEQQTRSIIMSGWRMLLYKEVLAILEGEPFKRSRRRCSSAVLYLLIFGHVLEDRVQVYDQLSYTAFLLPGLIMMSVLQNAFANSSSSLGAKQNHGQFGVLVAHTFVPLALVCGLCVARPWCAVWLLDWGVFAVTVCFAPLQYRASAVDLGVCHFVAGVAWALWAWWRACGQRSLTKWQPFRSFVIMPMTFLSRACFIRFILCLCFWQKLSHLNPFFYMIDGFQIRFLRSKRCLALAQLELWSRCWWPLPVWALVLMNGYKFRG
jgi:ABC-2 type transport system permease protein